jgi:CHASE1-domain containing sensor protein
VKALAIGLGVACTGLTAAVVVLARRRAEDQRTLEALAAAHMEVVDRYHKLRAALIRCSWVKA